MIQDPHNSLESRKLHKINSNHVKRTEKRRRNCKHQIHFHDNSNAILIIVIWSFSGVIQSFSGVIQSFSGVIQLWKKKLIVDGIYDKILFTSTLTNILNALHQEKVKRH